MSFQLQSKVVRYRGMFRAIYNWPQYLLYKFSGSSRPFQFRCRNGLHLTVPGELIHVFKQIFFDRAYVQQLPSWWWKIDNPVVVDVGANLGYFSLFIAVEKPDVTIHAFEPVPANFRMLEKNQSEFPDVDWHIYPEAVSGGPESLELYYEGPDKYTDSAGVVQMRLEDTQTLVVKAISITRLMSELVLEKIDFLKLDCEGSEYGILYSLPQSAFDQIGYMMIETHKTEIENHDHITLLRFVQEKGFQTRSLIDKYTGYIWASRP